MQTEKDYITLTRIAELLGENYSTIRHYKKKFNEYLDVRLFGRQVRYAPGNVELFMEILDMKENGFSDVEIEAALRDNKTTRQQDNMAKRQGDKQVSKQASEQISKQADQQVSQQVSEQADQQASEQADQQASEQADEQVSKQAGRQASEQADKQASELIKNFHKKIGDKMKLEITDELYERLQKKMIEQKTEMESSINKLIKTILDEMNHVMAKSHENQQLLCQAVSLIEKRIGELEAELDFEPKTKSESEINLSAYADIVPEPIILAINDDPKQAPSTMDALDPEIEPLMQCVKNGAVDKSALISWIKKVRSVKPCPSYATLAERLDKAGVPTLSGRGGWSRGTLSKLELRASVDKHIPKDPSDDSNRLSEKT